MKEEGKSLNNDPCCEETCCGSSEPVTSTEKKLMDPNKLNIDIYVPLNACACEWSQFMNRIFEILTPYIKHIKYETKSLNSEEARDLNLRSNCVLIDGEKKYTTAFALKRDLPRLLKERGININ